MARQRSPDRDKAKQLWIESSGELKLKDIAAKLGLGETQIRKWKSIDKWDDELNSNVTKPETPKSNVTNPKGGAPKGNKNAAGHGAPPGNRNAEKHGLFAKYLPPETLELVEHLQEEDQVAKLKRNIAIQEAAIIRAQSIMNVESKDELITHLKKQSDTSQEWEFQYAWDRQGNFMASLARAMASLTGMYKLLAELEPDDTNQGVKERIDSFVGALTGSAEEVWADEEASE